MFEKTYFADFVLLPAGCAESVCLTVNGEGYITEVRAGAMRSGAEYLGHCVVPAIPNIHSHAFQRAMAGSAESMSNVSDSFWTWREKMYHLSERLTPEQVQAIAEQLYVELISNGYSSVCEFHYLHHDNQGNAYDVLEEMSLALLQAAENTGIGMTLLPTLYMSGGFDGRALNSRQNRFANSVDQFQRLLSNLSEKENAQTRIGYALHSLRAVPQDALAQMLKFDFGNAPIHIHIAEQEEEVQDCLAHYAARPVQWLLENAPVDERWCLVHATHMNSEETRRLAKSNACVALCPTTEANLGDGIFPLADYRSDGGTFGIGSDSNISVSPIEELRWLEYGQRLWHRRRNILATPAHPRVGSNLWDAATVGGAQASGRAIGSLKVGHRADWLVLDEAAAEFAGKNPKQVLDTLVFAGNRNLVKHVMVGGVWQVRDGVHIKRDEIAAKFSAVMKALND